MHMPNYDRIDREILTHLQADGRMANTELADAVRLSPSACLRRVKALESDGLISGYQAELSRDALGLDLTVFVELRVDKHSRQTSQDVADALTAIPSVVSCHVISGAADFFIEIAAENLRAYEQILLDQILAIDAIVDARSTFAIRTVKTHGALPVDTVR
jgi:Lrp/AsnC family transcriptional regulator, leucine-responsive regulatory protein